MINTTARSFFFLILIFTLSTLFFSTPAHAACGDITYTGYSEDGELVTVTEPIADCTNPFKEDETVNFTATLTLAGQTVEEGLTINIPHASTTITGQYGISSTGIGNGAITPLRIFRYTNPGYEEVYYTDGQPLAIENVEAGDYTAVFVYTELFFMQDTLWQRFKNLLIPTAWAYTTDYDQVMTMDFSIAIDPPLEPTGASSVLFLPGIMGSRLYEESEVCDSSDTTQERWFSRDECDQLRLETNFMGKSINEIYTEGNESSIIDEVYVINLYKKFLDTLQDWKADDLIDDYVAAPYDWRLGLDELMQTKKNSNTEVVSYQLGTELKDSYLYEEVSKLAESSHNGKVTIVAHSNGGLLAKHFLSELEQKKDPILQKIDNLILVGVPQTGTPDAVVGILHGTELDFVMKQEVARQLMNNMAFVHHLLPTTAYFSSVNTPVIKFEEGSATNAWRDKFGETITSKDSLHSFLHKESGRTKPDNEDLATPQVVDSFLLNYADVEETIQSSWTPPTGLKVYQIAGTGLETLSQITYFTDRECVSRSFFRCTEYKDKLGYRVNMSIDGDETVVVPSALAMSKVEDSVERWWLDFKEYNKNNIDLRHRSMLEVVDVIDFIESKINNQETLTYDYLKAEEPVFDTGDRLVFQLHSPLDMHLSTSDGGILSSTTNTINDATYRRYGELQYISVPRENNVTLHLDGTAEGSFTLDIEEFIAGSPAVRQTYSAIPSTLNTKVVQGLSFNEPVSDVELELDYDGDGVVDKVYDLEDDDEDDDEDEDEDEDEEEDEEEDDQVTYEDLIEAIQALGLSAKEEKRLLRPAKLSYKSSEKTRHKKLYNKLEKRSLEFLVRRLEKYQEEGLIPDSEKEEIESIIENLQRR